MFIRRKKGWEIAESAATPESVFLNRRGFLVGAGAATTAASILHPAAAQDADPSAGLYPAKQNPRYKLDGKEITAESVNANYNNFYEFGFSKQINRAAQALKTRP